MTDKQIINERRQYEYKSVYPEKSIIIDGVDVSGCPHYIHKDGSCSSQDCECIKCVHNACFYKDYKTKEQECEELKEDRERWKSNFNGKVSAIEELLQQLDQLKQILAKIKEICNNNDELQGDFNLVDCDKYKLGKHNLANKILQKISECEVKNK